MSNNFDYGFDVNTNEKLNTSKKESITTNEVGHKISTGNEYYNGEKEAIKKWLKENKKAS
ncbi:MAG: hypothetical protein COA44_03480 [Arcobacter sp.]|nr:MAG: hypothetical protein COA44_03480 [Arcobacter sp.]